MQSPLPIIIATFTIFLTYIFGRYGRWLDFRRIAKDKFFKSFEGELLVLRQERDITTYQVLRKAFKKQLAINEFKRHLSKRQARCLDSIWHDYYHNPNGKRLQQYEPTTNHEESEKRRLLALQRLEKVLHFSKHKFSLF